MKAQRFDEYHKHGCNFEGKLVVVNYWEDMEKDTRYGQFGSMIQFDYLDKAKQLVLEKYGEPKRVLLGIPDYVVEIA